MIKAENITHEGTPAATWLDKCRSLILPLSTGAVIIIIAIVIFLVSRPATNTIQASTQSPAASQALEVTPLSGAGQAAGAAADTEAQSATTANTANVSAIPTADGAPVSSTTEPIANQQLQSAISSLSQQAQATAQGAQNNLNNLVSGTLKGL